MNPRRLVVLTVLIGGFTAFGPLSMDLYLPAFPQLVTDLGTDQAEVQLTLTAVVAGGALAALLATLALTRVPAARNP